MKIETREIFDWLEEKEKFKEITKLPGDASTRSYYRATTGSGSFIVMKVAPFTQEGENYPFIAVQKHLSSVGVQTPKVLKKDAQKGLVLLEDLGDITLLRKLQEVSDQDTERHLYERVIDTLVDMQSFASSKDAVPSLEHFRLRFDFEKLDWEVQFTMEHFYLKHLGRKIRPPDLKVIKDGFASICQTLADQPTVFTHRDFHSRNIMIVPAIPEVKTSTERIVLIDFQDARMGPAQYDLASLLKDSYYQLDEAQVDRLIDYYIARLEAAIGVNLNRDEFRRVFDLMSIQRNFKAIGSFASFQNLRGISTYLKYIGNTFENIRRSLLKFPDHRELREALFHYYYF